MTPICSRGLDQVRQHLLVHGDSLPFPVKFAAPVLFFIIKGHISHHAADRIGELAGQPEGKVTGEEQVFVSFRPDFRLVFLQPVGFGFSLQIGDRFAHAGHVE